jgi:glycosyltransferase involved in cell wall biosynthesis
LQRLEKHGPDLTNEPPGADLPATKLPVFFRVAIVHEWLVTLGGSERVLRELISLYPDCDLFTVVDFLNDAERAEILGKHARTTFIQKLPFARKKYRTYLPLMPFAIEQLDLSEYDLIISSSHAVAKGVITGPDQLHICYCHSPIRYAWDLQHQYLHQSGLTRGLKSLSARLILHYIRIWDTRTAIGVDKFVANSAFIARRIQKLYRRDALVIHPPVDIGMFTARLDKEDFYLTASRLVPYKRVDLIVEAFASMPQRRLIVIGDGPEMERVRKLAGPNVTLLGFQSNDVLRDHLQRARAFVFGAEEDFGILPVEAQACGTPVIAFGKGGALETVIGLDNAQGKAPTGLFFDEQTVPAVIDAVERFEMCHINPADCRAWAENFSIEVFRKAFNAVVSG